MSLSSNFRHTGKLTLEDGKTFTGILFGAETSSADFSQQSSRQVEDKGCGEVVFNTSMTGYQEILTDPSYYGEIVTFTSSHIGNTGINFEDEESSQLWCAGLITRSSDGITSNWRSKKTLDSYLKEASIPGLMDVDTRAITRYIREKGALRGVITPIEEKVPLDHLPVFEGRDLIQKVSTPHPYDYPAPEELRYRIVAIDYGIKANLLRSLRNLGCQITVVPAHTSAQEILDRHPEGVFLSNGPGDPSAAPYAVETVRKLIGKLPLFGVCMGHQILSQAFGAKTYKLKFGHRGGNQPVQDLTTQKVEISSHNHGYAVDPSSLPPSVRVSHVNLNDRCVEGIESDEAFSVQYHPEACPGPHDSMLLLSRFIDRIDRWKCTRNTSNP